MRNPVLPRHAVRLFKQGLVCAVLFNLFLGVYSLWAAETVAIDPAVRYQKINSWGAPSGLIGNPESLLDPILDELVHGLGLTRLRLEPPRREWENPLNDDTDPFHVQNEAFRTAGTDERVQKVFLPFKKRVEADGERFEFYVSPSFFDGGSSGTAPSWLQNSPGEYAEWACEFLRYLRRRYGLEADYYGICNEAGNNNSFSASVVANLAKALGPRLEALGFSTKIQFPECVNADSSWSYIQNTANDVELWRWVGLVSYHLYGGNSTRAAIQSFASSRNLPTAQTEYMGLTLNHLYDDLTIGGVSTWEFYALNDLLSLDTSRSWFSRTQAYWQTRQVLRFVRPGAVRIAATSSTNAVRALAFAQQTGTTLVLLNTQDGTARNVEITGLPDGEYGRSRTVGAGPAQELGLVSTAGGTLAVALPGGSTLTFYPHPGSNQPPVITDWRATPSFLKHPSSSLALSASASDPEGGAVKYEWSVVGSPAGANVALSTPQAANCAASGLMASGDYLFEIRFSDGTNVCSRRLPVRVLEGNQAPELFDVHNRLPTTVTLPARFTTLRCAGRDLEGDLLVYHWSIVAQPAGANAILMAPAATSCIATNLNVAGDYVFRIVLVDSGHSVSNDLAVTVYPPNRAPTVMASVKPSPVLAPSTSAVLSASTLDADNDPVSVWWSVGAAPPGAIPCFSNQGSNITAVSGLIIPGAYTFRVAVLDRAGAGSSVCNLNVVGDGKPRVSVATPNGGETYVTGQKVRLRWSSYQANGPVKLEYLNGTQWKLIAEQSENDGEELWIVPAEAAKSCRFRVSLSSDPGVVDESDATFSIRSRVPEISGLWLLNGLPHLEFEQVAGRSFEVQRRPSFDTNHEWETVSQWTNLDGTASWDDPAGINAAAAFYRLMAK